jgi:hypothetical protein
MSECWNNCSVPDMTDSDNGNRRRALIAIAAVVLLAAVGWYLARALSQSARLQDCLLSGRTNCAQLEAPR